MSRFGQGLSFECLLWPPECPSDIHMLPVLSVLATDFWNELPWPWEPINSKQVLLKVWRLDVHARALGSGRPGFLLVSSVGRRDKVSLVFY